MDVSIDIASVVLLFEQFNDSENQVDQAASPQQELAVNMLLF